MASDAVESSSSFRVTGLALGLSVAVYVIAGYLRAVFRLRHIPGPWLASLSPFWLFYHNCRGERQATLKQLHARYGPLIRVSIDQLCTDDPDLYKIMNGSSTTFSRGRWYDAFKADDGTDMVFSARDKTVHAKLKAKLSPGYLGKDGLDLEKAIDPIVLNLLTLIKETYCESGTEFDFAPMSMYFTMDSLSKFAYGQDTGHLRKNADIFQYYENTLTFAMILELFTDHPWILNLVNRIGQSLKPSPKDKTGIGAIMSVAYRAIEERFEAIDESKPSQNDILESLIRKGLTKSQCQNEAMISILAGSDSTSQVLRSTFINILSAPTVYGRLSSEIKSAIDAGHVSAPVIRNSEAVALPYLQACIKEGLRILQPLNGFQSKKAPPEGLSWNGYRIPGGTEIGVSQYTLLHRKDVFGHDAEMYRPERWLEETDPVKLRNMQNAWGMAFGGGSGVCLGKNIALLELNKAVFELFRTFDFQRVDPLAEVKTYCRSVVKQEGMIVRAYPKSFH